MLSLTEAKDLYKFKEICEPLKKVCKKSANCGKIELISQEGKRQINVSANQANGIITFTAEN